MPKYKTCDNCTYQDRTYNDPPCNNCKPDKWRDVFENVDKIQDEPMSDKIQMTEEQAMCLYRMAGDGHVEFIKILKQVGIIRKTAVEEAEEMYKEWLNRIGDMSETVVMDKMYSAIQELKSEIARLEK